MQVLKRTAVRQGIVGEERWPLQIRTGAGGGRHPQQEKQAR